MLRLSSPTYGMAVITLPGVLDNTENPRDPAAKGTPRLGCTHCMWFCRPLLLSGGTATTLLNFKDDSETSSTWTGMEWMTPD